MKSKVKQANVGKIISRFEFYLHNVAQTEQFLKRLHIPLASLRNQNKNDLD